MMQHIADAVSLAATAQRVARRSLQLELARLRETGMLASRAVPWTGPAAARPRPHRSAAAGPSQAGPAGRSSPSVRAYSTVSLSASSDGRGSRRTRIQAQTRSQAPTRRAASDVSANKRSPSGDEPGRAGSKEQLRPSSRSDSGDSCEQTAHKFSKAPLASSSVPTSRLGRLVQYGGLAAGLGLGALSESLRRRATGSSTDGSVFVNEANLNRLVSTLSHMRGAALKLGQILSIQDTKLLPEALQRVLLRVQDSANYMPPSQLNSVMRRNLGTGWKNLFSDFSDIPIAAASIGQVHAAVWRETGMPVAVKVQYPGIGESIDSDLDNINMILIASNLLPKGMFLDKTIEHTRVELAWEVDYQREAECIRMYSNYLADDSAFLVPRVVNDGSTAQVLTMERMFGLPLNRAQNLSQEVRDYIGSQIIRLCFREIAEFAYMQTDPNWTNFFYNDGTKKIELLDFGAARPFPKDFISNYVALLKAAADNNRELSYDVSKSLGYLIGHESQSMINAHIDSMLVIAEPFRIDAPTYYDFSQQDITDRVKAAIPLMLKQRLTPPPPETYSLHRKLSGIFLLCAKLGARIPCRSIFEQIVLNPRSF